MAKTTRISTTQSGEIPRESIRTTADAVRTITRPRGGASARSSTRTRPAVHMQSAAQISGPFGFTTPPMNSVIGVTARSTPTSMKVRLDHAQMLMNASATKSADSAALTSRMA